MAAKCCDVNMPNGIEDASKCDGLEAFLDLAEQATPGLCDWIQFRNTHSSSVSSSKVAYKGLRSRAEASLTAQLIMLGI